MNDELIAAYFWHLPGGTTEKFAITRVLVEYRTELLYVIRTTTII
jgi:hypothetical protein